ncbi:hypothetical protein PG988_000818 [Apiospora saccharicola]
MPSFPTLGTEDHKPGYCKILFCGAQARRDGLEYFWVDTCCIDKTSSAELTEAINSMYRYYEGHGTQDQAEAGPVSYGAVPNYTGLSYTSRNYISRNLVTSGSYTRPNFENLPAVPSSDLSWQSSFRRSRCFTRGWTLQELLAPSKVEFFTSNGRMIGDRQSLKNTIQSVTGIPLPAFQSGWQSAIPVHERIHWSNKRKTTRPEDKVYSLLGIVGVSMPVVYGEGEAEAFIRLCKEVKQRYEKYKGIVADSLNSKGESPTLYASENGHEAIVRILLDAKASTEPTDDGGDSPLILAARAGHEPVVRLLLDRGAKIDAADRSGHSALYYASKGGHEKTAKLLQSPGKTGEPPQKGRRNGARRSGAQGILSLFNS